MNKSSTQIKFKIDFFGSCIKDAIKGGIYMISVINAVGEKKPLYIGESFSMLIRCSTHLFELEKNPHYLGFTPEIIQVENIMLVFEILDCCDVASERKAKEKIYIKQYAPLSQSGWGDRMKPIEEKINAIHSFLETASKQ